MSEPETPPSEVTELLNAWRAGDDNALHRLVPLVNEQLRVLASLYLRKEGPGHTLQPTALVNEAYLRLIGWKSDEWQNRSHFFAVAAKMMRRILVNQALHKGAQKRGGSALIVSLEEVAATAGGVSADILAVDEALARLATFDARKSQLIELRFFGGLSAEEAAEVMGITVRTVRREWTLARAWLFKELSGSAPPGQR